MKSEEISLTDALSYAARTALPAEYDPKGQPWVLAIVHVTKCNGKSNYAIAENDGYGRPVITKDFGSVARIVKTNKIFPYILLNNMNLPDLRNHTDIVNYLSHRGYDENDVRYLLGTKDKGDTDKTEEQKKADKLTVKSWIICEAIKNQIQEINYKHSTEQDY